MSIYIKAQKNKKIAAQILLPLIEFEFGFLGNDSPELIQSPNNKEQFEKIFQICKKHVWINSMNYKRKGNNLYFRMSKSGFKEVFEIAGPFSSNYKNEWASLLLERHGIIGGYQVNKKRTCDRILGVIKNRKYQSIQEMCLNLRLTPGTIREGLKDLKKKDLISRKRVGKSFYYRMK
jgi:DNA-binding transcriptional ArsR family regulator